MGGQRNRRDLPRLGSRRAGFSYRVNIEALEPRTLFSDAHGLLRADISHAQLQSDLSSRFDSWAHLHAALEFSSVAVAADKALSGFSDQMTSLVALHDSGPFGQLLRLEQSLGGTAPLNVYAAGNDGADLHLLQQTIADQGVCITIAGYGQRNPFAISDSVPRGILNDYPSPGDASRQAGLVELPVPPDTSAPSAAPGLLRKGSYDAASGSNPFGAEPVHAVDGAQYLAGKILWVERINWDTRADPSAGQAAAPAPQPGGSAQTTLSASPAFASSQMTNNYAAPSPVVTPLALTPAARAIEVATTASAPAAGTLVVHATPARGAAETAANSIPSPAETAPAGHPIGLLAAALPAVMHSPQSVALISDAVQTASGMMQVTGNIASHATDLFSSAIPADSVPATVAYNFVHIDAAFNDAVTAFANELASMSAPGAASHSTLRAWAITAAVIGFDTVLLAYWYRKVRRENGVRRAAVPGKLEPCDERLL